MLSKIKKSKKRSQNILMRAKKELKKIKIQSFTKTKKMVLKSIKRQRPRMQKILATKLKKKNLVNLVLKKSKKSLKKRAFQIKKFAKVLKNHFIRNKFRFYHKKIAKYRTPYFKRLRHFRRSLVKNRSNKYFMNCWSSFKNNSEIRDFLALKKQRQNFFNLRIKLEFLKTRLNVTPLSPVYAATFFGYKKKKNFSIKPYLYHSYGWLETSIFKRQLYRLTRTRVSKKERLTWRQRRYRFYVQFLNIVKPRKKAVDREKTFISNKILTKYIMRPFFEHLKQKPFNLKWKKWRKIQNRQGFNVWNTKYENQLFLVANRLNFAPNFYWGKLITRLGWISVSNAQNVPMKIDSVLQFYKHNPIEISMPI